jgi:hypothetical protein
VTDDFPERSWVEIQIPAGDVPRSVRLRHWLKLALRAYGIRVVKVSGTGPTPVVEREDAAETGAGPTV